jgi:hypothetical protein
MSDRPSKDLTTYYDYRRICDALAAELKQADSYIANDTMTDEGLEIVVEVEGLLDELYKCNWGERECLKRAVVAISSQINNIQWTRVHVAFLKDVVHLLQITYLVDDSFIAMCYCVIRDHMLDQFRGTVMATEVKKRYKIVEVDNS